MPLYLDKVLAQMAYPVGLSIGLLLLGLLFWACARPRWAAGSMILGIFWVTLWSLPAVSDALRLSLEGQYDNVPVADLPAADVAIVLGGGLRASPPEWPYPDLLMGADRLWHAARIYRSGKSEYVLVSGGNHDWVGPRGGGADAMMEFLSDLGVPESAILLEDRSRNTRENAVYSKEILEQYRLEQGLLVTSALHMPRAMATFHAAGLDPIPAPADFEIMPEPPHILRWLPDAEALAGSTRALKEYLGYWVYRLRGWAE